jgi:hypothetical protein
LSTPTPREGGTQALRSLARIGLLELESRLSLLAAALLGCQDLATDVPDVELRRSIRTATLQALATRMQARDRIRAMDRDRPAAERGVLSRRDLDPQAQGRRP